MRGGGAIKLIEPKKLMNRESGPRSRRAAGVGPLLPASLPRKGDPRVVRRTQRHQVLGVVLSAAICQVHHVVDVLGEPVASVLVLADRMLEQVTLSDHAPVLACVEAVALPCIGAADATPLALIGAAVLKALPWPLRIGEAWTPRFAARTVRH